MSESSTWFIAPIKTPFLTWGERRGTSIHCCPYCGLHLLTGERPGFCCGKEGQYLQQIPPLPPLPPQYDVFITHPQISSLSRVLNLIFSFAALETTHEFPEIAGPPGFFAVQGRVYHRVRPNHENSAVRWFLYDGFMRDKIPHPEWAAIIPPAWIEAVATSLCVYNPFLQSLLHLSSLNTDQCPSAHLTIEDSGTTSEIAAVMNYANTTVADARSRNIVVIRRDGENQSIHTISRLWEPLAYPLLFPHATLGWGVVGSADEIESGQPQQSSQEELEGTTRQIMYYHARILREPRFEIFGRLTNEYLVDMFSRNLETRLNYIRMNQKRLRQEDAALMGVTYIPDHQNIYLPASFLGSNKWASEQIADSLAIAAAYGPPTFFITFTCNTNWPEIRTRLLPGQDFMDVPVVVVRVFHQKLTALESTLKTMFPNAGRLLYMVHSIEFQKRGVPHTHILLKFERDCIHPDDIDAVVSAEMPSDSSDAELVRNLMVHNHPSPSRPPSKYCQKLDDNGHRICRFGYPHALQSVTSIDCEGRPHYRRRNNGDEMIVPHCLPLLRKFQCHLNFEVANTSHLFQYLFKYIHKGKTHLLSCKINTNSLYRPRSCALPCPFQRFRRCRKRD
jgi:hypothetical protein